MNLSPERIAKREASKMTLMPEAKKVKIKKLIIRKDDVGDLEIERTLNASDKIEILRTIRTSSALARGGVGINAPSIETAEGEIIKGDNLKDFISNL